jgi:hypothetical protein
MFPIRSVLVAAVAAGGLLLLSAAPVVAGDKIKIENPLGFHTSMSGEFLRAYWESVKDQHKMKGKVSDHLTKDQIDTVVVLEMKIATPSLKDELLAFMTEGNRFETGPLPKGFDKSRPMKLVVALFRTKKGDYGLITRFSKLTVIELNGYVGVAPSP